MTASKFFLLRICVTVFLSLAILGLLLWQHFHGGVPAHHILADKSLPKISNWPGAAVIPLLSWLLSYRVQKRIFAEKTGLLVHPNGLRSVALGFFCALIFGVSLAAVFTLGYDEVPGYMIMVLFPLALFYPVYRSENFLGFVVGMTFTFGAVLPTIFASFLTLICFIIWRYIRSLTLRLIPQFSIKKESST